MDRWFICDVCGHTTKEKTGQVYYCTECGNQMRITRDPDYLGQGGDPNPDRSVLAWDLMYLVFFGGLSFGVMNYLTYWTPDVMDWLLFFVWLVIFVLVWVLFHRFVKGQF